MIRELTGLILLIGGCTCTIIILALGTVMPGWLMICWVAFALAGWLLLTLVLWLVRLDERR